MHACRAMPSLRSGGRLPPTRSVIKFWASYSRGSCERVLASLKLDVTVPLTAQQLECLTLSAHGQTSTDIALKLGIKPRTVNFHFAKVLRKLNAMNRQEAIAKAVSANLLRM